MDLETDTSRAFSEIKKAKDDTIIMRDRDINAVKKFFLISFYRTTFCRDHTVDVIPNKNLPDIVSDAKTRAHRKIWLDMLQYILQRPFQDLASLTDQDIINSLGDCSNENLNFILTQGIRVCKTIAAMRMHIWKSPPGKEFLLGDPSVRIEGLEMITDKEKPSCAHLFLPISPNIVMVLCNEVRCTQLRSMVSEEVHALPQLHIIPSKKKLGQRGYRPEREVWKYPITTCDESHLLVFNCLTIASTRVVFRMEYAFRETKNAIISFKLRFEARQKVLRNLNAKTPSNSENSLKDRQKLFHNSLQDQSFRLLQFMEMIDVPEVLISRIRLATYLLLDFRNCRNCEAHILNEFLDKVIS